MQRRDTHSSAQTLAAAAFRRHVEARAGALAAALERGSTKSAAAA
jgi:hypothetical protein